MNSIHELIYDYLKQQDSPVTSKHILENAVPKYLNKKELNIVLQELEDENRIVKEKLSNTYHYSLNPEEFDDDYDSYYDIDKDSLNVTFNENKTYKNETYSVGIPDGYTLGVDENDFIAWLPKDGDPDSCYSGYNVIKQFRTDTLSNVFENTIKEEISFNYKLSMTQQYELMFDKVHVLDTSSLPFPCCIHFYYSGCWHAFITLFSNGFVSNFRMQMNALSLQDRELAHKIVLDWVKTIKTDNPVGMAKELDDISYQTMTLNEENIEEYFNALIEYKKQLRQLRTSHCGIVVNNCHNNDFKTDKTNMEVKSLLYDYSKIMACEYRKLSDTVRKIICQNPDNPLIVDLYALAIAYMDEPEKVTINTDNYLIDIPDIDEIKASIKTEELAKYASEIDEKINFYTYRLEKERKVQIIEQYKYYIEEKKNENEMLKNILFGNYLGGSIEILIPFAYDDNKKIAENAVSRKIKNLKKSIKDAENLQKQSILERERIDDELTKTKLEYEKLTKEESDVKNSINRKFNNIIDNYNNEFKIVAEQKEHLESTIEKNTHEIESLGFFSMGRKKTLKNENLELSSNLVDARKKYEDINKKIAELNNQKNIELNNYDNDIKQLREKLDKLMEDKEKSDQAMKDCQETDVDNLKKQLSDLQDFFKDFEDEYIYHQLYLRDLKEVFENFGIKDKKIDYDYHLEIS